jgi:hypothetical protein
MSLKGLHARPLLIHTSDHSDMQAPRAQTGVVRRLRTHQ